MMHPTLYEDFWSEIDVLYGTWYLVVLSMFLALEWL